MLKAWGFPLRRDSCLFHEHQLFFPKVDVCIEAPEGEDAVIFFDEGGADQRMNETCAGGTGAFIDQMAALLKTDAAGLNDLAREHNPLPDSVTLSEFAKTDVKPLMNEGLPGRPRRIHLSSHCLALS